MKKLNTTRSTPLRARLGALLLAPVLLLGAAVLAPSSGAASLNVNFSVTSVNFGTVTVGTSASGQAVVTNTGATSLYLKSADVHGGAAGDFVASTAGCAGAIAASGTCSIGVTFTPRAPNDRAADLAVILGIKHDGLFVATALMQVLLTGEGSPATFTLSNASAGSVAIGSSSIASATFTNTSSVPLDLHSWSLQGDVHSEFRIVAITCSTPVAPSQSCDVVVRFAPRLVGAVSATLGVSASVVGSRPLAYVNGQSTISGTGTRSGNASPIVSLSSLNFGAVTVGTSGSGSVAVVNTSAYTLTVSKLFIAGNDAKEFTLGSNTCTSSLAPTASCSINVTFTPSIPKLRNATLGLTVKHTIGTKTYTNAAVTSLAGTGVKPTVSLVAPDFGAVTIGSSTVNQVVLTNTSLAPLKYVKAILSGPHLPSWKVSSTTCLGSVAPGANCEVELTFAPHTAGNLSIVLSAQLQITVGSRTVEVKGQATVAGEGVEPTFTDVPSALGPTDQGVATTGTATITNTSDVALTFKGAHFAGALDADFAVTGNTCSAQLAPAGTCTLSLRFKPKQVGAGSRKAFLVATLQVDGISPAHYVSTSVVVVGQES